MSVALVGSAAARAIQGFSAGADVALLFEPGTSRPEPSVLHERLIEVGCTGQIRDVSDLVELSRLALTSSERPLVVAAADVDLAVPAMLDLLDRPGVMTAALLADPQASTDGLARTTPVRVGPDGVAIESSGTTQHTVSRPNRISVGLLRIDATDRTTAARLWLAAAAAVPLGEVDAHAGAVLALVRGGVRVQAQNLGQFGWSRTGVSQPGAPGSAWQQRLRSASRGGDGFFSTFVVRPLSRRWTGVGLRLNLSPNLTTMISLVVGLVTAGLIWTGEPWAWIVAAVTLQVALLIDCMDGEIARFTRRFSTLGGWLDGVGDRVKEYAVFAALAAVAARDGSSWGWPLAIIAMVVVTARHLEDYSFNDSIAADKTSRPVLLPLDRVDDGGGAADRTTFASALSRSSQVRFWAKKIIHVPIAERYLILSLGLLTLRPIWVLGAALVLSAFALLWTQGGRLVLAVLRLCRGRRAAGESDGKGDDHPLDDQLDLGPLAAVAGRLVRLPFLSGFGAALLVWLGAIAAICLGQSWWALLLSLVAGLLVGSSCRPPLVHPLAWQALPLIWLIEGAFFAALLTLGVSGGAIFAFLAVVAYRRYDLIYTIRLNRTSPRRLATLLGLGADGRMFGAALALVITEGLADDAARAVGITLFVAAGLLLLNFGGESVRQWRAAGRRSQQLG